MRNDVYTAKEIIELAIQAKARAVDLYMVLARNSGNYHVGRLFAELAKSGQKNKMHLEKLLSSLAPKERDEAYPGERALYLKSLVDSNAFHCDTAMKKALELTINETDALQAGISFKKDFMLFMHDLKHHASQDAKNAIDMIIDEEIKNLQGLFHLQEKISGK